MNKGSEQTKTYEIYDIWICDLAAHILGIEDWDEEEEVYQAFFDAFVYQKNLSSIL